MDSIISTKYMFVNFKEISTAKIKICKCKNAQILMVNA